MAHIRHSFFVKGNGRDYLHDLCKNESHSLSTVCISSVSLASGATGAPYGAGVLDEKTTLHPINF